MASYTQITNNIFVGNIYTAIQSKPNEDDYIEKLKIKVVISALTEEEYEDYMIGEEDFPGIDWYRFVIDDCQRENILQSFFTVYKIINKSILEGKNILIHCAAGVSRSPTLAIAYLMIDNKWSTEEAVDYVRKKRPEIDPNVGFIRQLKMLEYKLKLSDTILTADEKLKDKTD
jgi:protein-tyrosine phosphatase